MEPSRYVRKAIALRPTEALAARPDPSRRSPRRTRNQEPRTENSRTVNVGRVGFPPPIMWQHNYQPGGGSLAASTVAAAVPIFVLFLMLGVLRKPAWMSAMAALVSALVVALAIYGMPAQLAIIS